MTAEDWEYTFRTNIHAMFYLTQAAWAHLEHDCLPHEHLPAGIGPTLTR